MTKQEIKELKDKLIEVDSILDDLTHVKRTLATLSRNGTIVGVTFRATGEDNKRFSTKGRLGEILASAMRLYLKDKQIELECRLGEM